jgi:photosystem II stability/assembly factor-like uncharacterized protein
MRSAVLVLVALLVIPTARAQWVREAPLPTGQTIRGVAHPAPGRLFVVTDDNTFDDAGALHESADNGATWTSRDEPNSTGAGFNGVAFVDAQHGWLYGNENFRTTDGGTTWEALPLLGSTYGWSFATPLVGVATGNFGAQLTRDGGLTWVAAPAGIYALRFADAQTGLGLSGAGLYRTTDGGATFAAVAAGDALDAVFVTPSVAVAIVAGRILRSADAGATWTDVASAGPHTRLSRVGTAVLAWEEASFAGAGPTRLARSTDGGASWTDLGAVVPGGAYALTAASAQSAVILETTGGLLHSGDGGATWTRALDALGPAPLSFGELAPVFADATSGAVGFGSGLVLRTADGGATWQAASSGYGAALRAVARLGSGALMAVGAEEDRGVVQTRGADGRWQLRAAPGAAPLVSVQPTGGASANALDATGIVHRTTDGGASWSAATGTPTLTSATDAAFVSGAVGYVSGGGFGASALWRTSDGGATWAPVQQGDERPEGQYVAVEAIGESAWAARFDGFLWRTSDGGATWTTARLPGFEGEHGISDMAFWDEATGYMVGFSGAAFRTADGGATWTALPTPTPDHHFSDVTLVGPNELWASTRQGVAYYSATAGQSWAAIPVGEGGFSGDAAIAADAAGRAWTVREEGHVFAFAGPPPPPDNRPPVAAFSFDAARLAVAFTDQSTDPDGTIASRAWDFGDGATSTETNPAHTFAGAGTYIVRLAVTDDDGAQSETIRIVTVSPGPGGTFGDFTEVTPLDPYFDAPQDEDFWVATTAAADVDADGDLDLAVLGYYVIYNESVTEQLLLFRNDGPEPADPDVWRFTRTEVPAGDLTAGASDMAWGDADGDGDPDLVVGSDGLTVLYRNDAGTLVPTDTVLPGYFERSDQGGFDQRSITWADVDNDGDLDLLLPSVFDADESAFRTALMRNDGADGAGGWVFTEVEAGLDATSHAQAAWADEDGDGDLDLLLTNVDPFSDNVFVRRYRNDAGSFAAETLLGGLTVDQGTVDWGDADGDGDLDLLVAGIVNENDAFETVLRVYVNTGAGYTESTILQGFGADGWFGLTAAAWADYDSDGDVDILLTGEHNPGTGEIEGRSKIYLNDGVGGFTAMAGELPAPRPLGSQGGAYTWLDLDGDGDLDYFVAGFYFVPGGNGLVEAQMHVYRNDATQANAAPSAPTALVATPGGSTVDFAWQSAADDSTPAAALTYDLVVQRAGAPTASVTRLPEPGSISAATAWRLTGLEEGAYTWTVRAVDSAFNGGAVASGSFTVGPTAGSGPADAPALALAAPSPNPSRGAVTVRYAVPAAADVTLEVLDVLGRRVAVLAEGPTPAGEHAVLWPAQGVPAGSYLVRLRADGRAETRQIVRVDG